MHLVGPSAYFCDLIQQSGELFTDFLMCVSEAVKVGSRPELSRKNDNQIIGLGRA